MVSDRPGIGALERAERAGVPSAVIRTKERAPEDVAAETLGVLGEHAIDVVFLAGYLKLLPGTGGLRVPRAGSSTSTRRSSPRSGGRGCTG